ncbi:hypothetical protein NEMIN01_0644 [Nematocida minor]|uniref:uncharacterized protein n=1 Tax=Nematocida minor TaxID=1912983 RepID=UPI00221FC67E|nr:uncharacterized protein NEMIN01_0644 [Nematocida minor]KAI5189691.1 hypothetical protein NEMIN01_0644 [Nematocida minor]
MGLSKKGTEFEIIKKKEKARSELIRMLEAQKSERKARHEMEKEAQAQKSVYSASGGGRTLLDCKHEVIKYMIEDGLEIKLEGLNVERKHIGTIIYYLLVKKLDEVVKVERFKLADAMADEMLEGLDRFIEYINANVPEWVDMIEKSHSICPENYFSTAQYLIELRELLALEQTSYIFLDMKLYIDLLQKKNKEIKYETTDDSNLDILNHHLYSSSKTNSSSTILHELLDIVKKNRGNFCVMNENKEVVMNPDIDLTESQVCNFKELLTILSMYKKKEPLLRQLCMYNENLEFLFPFSSLNDDLLYKITLAVERLHTDATDNSVFVDDTARQLIYSQYSYSELMTDLIKKQEKDLRDRLSYDYLTEQKNNSWAVKHFLKFLRKIDIFGYRYMTNEMFTSKKVRKATMFLLLLVNIIAIFTTFCCFFSSIKTLSNAQWGILVRERAA